MKNYKDFDKTYIGSSDIATLTLVGMGEHDLKSTFLRFGGDDSYHAYIVDEDTEIGSHYTLLASFRSWLNIYDDSSLSAKFHADKINVYTAGYYGVIIQLVNK